MKRFDASFQSCGELQELFQPLSPDLVALQLSQGPLVGRLRIYSLGGFNFNLLEANQSLFLSGTRRTKPCTMAIPLVDHDPSSEDHYRAQGITMPWPGLMGYNRWLTDFDLKIPAGVKLATVVISKQALLERVAQQGGGALTLKRWEETNQLEIKPTLRHLLQQQVLSLAEQETRSRTPSSPDQLINILIQCFEDKDAQTMPIAKREARHEAAIELLHWCSKNAKQSITVDKLSAELFQSRTSLFKGSKEHFERTPLELHRSIRMDGVRQLLLDPRKRQSLGLQGVGAIANELGFTSRSHFARRYHEQYGEQPQDTLNRSTSALNIHLD